RKEYELSNELKEQLVLKSIQENVNEVAHSTSLEVDSNTTKVNAAELMNWQREVAENRLFIVRYIQQQMKQGVLKTPA
ncbi:transposase, partial [Acinetobacter baumannii]|nr:transposase [Acinetobacter baumannii]